MRQGEESLEFKIEVLELELRVGGMNMCQENVLLKGSLEAGIPVRSFSQTVSGRIQWPWLSEGRIQTKEQL